MNLTAFKAYDIRGLYPAEINKELAYLLGVALSKYLKSKKMAVGMDMRQSSPVLKKYLINGMFSQGVTVYDLGMCTTPLLNFTVVHKKLDGGVMITASHNPKEYNAFKIVSKNALMLHEGGGLNEIKNIIESLSINFTLPKSNDYKNSIKLDLNNLYVEHLLGLISLNKPLKIAVDFSNGVGAITAKKAFEKLPVEVSYIYDRPDGSFPNHGSDNNKHENYLDLQKLVKKTNADLGIFFDGDADRCSFVDESGKIILADFAFCTYIDSELKKNIYKNKRVYYDLRFSRVIKDVVEKNGGQAIVLRVGNPFYKEKLILEGGAMAAEMSGHIMFSENFSIDDGLYACLKMLDILSKTDKKMSSLTNNYKVYFTSPEINTNLKIGLDPQMVINKVKLKYLDGKISTLDGITVEYPSWWFNLRKSNTEPKVRLRVEANTEVLLEQKTKEILTIITTFTRA